MNHDKLGLVGDAPDSSGSDWDQYQETLKMLNLAVAQLGVCLEHGDDSVSSLAESFTVMAKSLSEIRELIPSIEDDKTIDKLALINNKCEHLSDKVDGAIMAFQFYDRLSQNLTHVSENLTSLGDMVTEQTRFENPSEWAVLQSDIRSRYTMPEERKMFDLVHQGASVDQAMRMVRQNELAIDTEEGEIELF